MKVPASGLSWPVIMRNSVVLPAPLGPITPTMPPGGSTQTAQIVIPVSERLGQNVVDFEGLTKGFGDNLLIDDLTFKLPPAASSVSSARTAPARPRCSA